MGVQDYNRLITQLEPFLPYIEEVYFAGGEPLFIDEHYRILKLLQDNNLYHVKLVYNTNFSVLEHKGFDILSVWSKFQQVFIAASLDDSYQRAELQRKEQNWQQTVNNRLLLLERCPNATFLITPTVSVFNVFNLPNFHKEWTEKGLVDAANFFPSMLSQPEIYNIRILPRSLKEQVAQIYSEHINWLKEQPTQYPNHKEVQLKDFKHCIDYMLSENWEHLIPQFKQRCAALDALRNESTADLFPELSILLD
ncbi:hypothetical protein C7N43_32490 [Sphingobacteriales bacterium UPWRP_1]|nr:hypothetical protein BVG80_11670 [Sphingobacteriales bacterium TSM_CSM]PSJ72768.1 hypothetical protein C7N43_32490 [Sphingobacteriales bacterium UPWRP_1]